MKTKNLLRAIAAVSLLTVFSCAKDIETEVTPIEQPNQVKTYTMTVVAGKGEVGTKALNLTDGTLNATWAENDVVTVYKSDTQIGTLTAQSSGQSTTLKGTLSGTINANDVLTLKFLDSNYATQDGTLDFIAANCDYATAEVTVSSTENDVITTTGNASFVNQQAIVEFTLKESDGAAISGGGVTSLIVTAGGTEITVTPTAATNVLYVAIPAISEGAISLQAVDRNGVPRSYEKTAATFENGQFYKIGVKMACIVMNDTQLFAAVEDSQVPEITLGADINLTRNETLKSRDVRINGANTTINLNNHFIAGFKYPGNDRPSGNIFLVYENKTLTVNGPGILKDATRGLGGAIYNNKGTVTLNDVTITGCDASRGGAIYNDDGTVTLTNVTFSGNRAEDTSSQPETSAGGAIYNSENATLNLNNVTFTGNSSKEIGGAIYNNGTLNVSGLIVASDNTAGDDADNVYLASGKVITLNGALTEGTSIGVTRADGAGVFTSGYSTNHGTTDPNTFFSSDDMTQQLSGVTNSNGEAYLVARDPNLFALNVPYLNQWEEPTEEIKYKDVCRKMSSYTPNTDITLKDGWYVSDAEELTFGRITISGTVNIILKDGTWLEATNSIYVPMKSTLHVWAQSYTVTGDSHQMGSLIATSGNNNWAAIGGASDGSNTTYDAGHLHIHGGTIVANGQTKQNAPGIYGAREIGEGKYGTYIYGGSILAEGGKWAPGIGCPRNCECGGIKITGGYVWVLSGDEAAGIGSGYCAFMFFKSDTYSYIPLNDERTEIRITGGEIIATGNGAGIGGGNGEDVNHGSGPIFIMSGGKVDAETTDATPVTGTGKGAMAIGWGQNPNLTFTPPRTIIGNPSIRAKTTNTNDGDFSNISASDFMNNARYKRVIIEY